jgi:hypothetical protein
MHRLFLFLRKILNKYIYILVKDAGDVACISITAELYRRTFGSRKLKK